jgi:hypothetical protein
MRGRPGSVRSLEELGRVQLSASVFMRDFLRSEIADFHGIPNIPNAPDLAIAAGRKLCARTFWKPLQTTFGRLAIRSAYRAPAVNEFGNATGSVAPRTYVITAATFGTVAVPRALWGRWRPSSCHGLPTATATAWIGAHSPGGSMTILPTASCSSSPNWLPSTSAGMSSLSGGSTALSTRRAA